ncbi:hypothetical protein M5X06_28305 [Paenibacillus alvei]|uniref:Phage XkdN-like protein n=1 Tax=Paenibacillus alvei TaxID=44250 RepID=A0ABT4H717_PAEAL|nr:hypothetical protein [Paenibacillus alvei]MCY9764777.1 hypothetical protein [Paenibacillus alvei]MCY9770684.1 hypothetical protein [Paenibacillus alvei]
MGKLQEFLMNNEVQTEVQVEVAIKPFPAPFVLRSITEAENKEIRKSCQKANWNKRTHQKEVETDADLYSNRLLIACCVDPNFKDAELQAKFGVVSAEDLIDKLLNPGQYTELMQKVQDLNGFNLDMNDLIAEAKN